MPDQKLISQIDSLLPQTQCGECQFADCLTYATAIANQDADINHCAPGGVTTLTALGKLLKRDIEAFVDEVRENEKPTVIAKIQEDFCIGCTKCIKACPVDAIIGSKKLMHTVITEECTGCELCVEPCPMDCIEICASVNSNPSLMETSKKRYYAKQARNINSQQNTINTYNENKLPSDPTNKQTLIQAAVARSKAKKQNNE